MACFSISPSTEKTIGWKSKPGSLYFKIFLRAVAERVLWRSSLVDAALIATIGSELRIWAKSWLQGGCDEWMAGESIRDRGENAIMAVYPLLFSSFTGICVGKSCELAPKTGFTIRSMRDEKAGPECCHDLCVCKL